MSDINVNGIPNMGFAGGQTGGGYMPNPFADVKPRSSNTLAANMRNQQIQQQAMLAQANSCDPFANTGDFGAQTAYYAGLGASYGRATGGFGGEPGRVGTISNPGTSNPGYLTSGFPSGYPSGQVQRGPDLQAPPWQNPFGGGSVFDSGADPWNPYANQLQQQAQPGGGIGSRGTQNPAFDWSGFTNTLRNGGLNQTPYGPPAPQANPFQQYASGGYNPFAAQSYAPAAQAGGGSRDYLAQLMRGNASPQAPAFPTGMGVGKADRLPLFSGGLKAQGGTYDSQEAADTAAGYGGIGSDMLRGNQNQLYAQPWHSLIPSGTPNTSEIIKQINYTAGRGRYDPAALAGVINTESRWNPATNLGSYFGATQMGQKSFNEAGGQLGGMNFNQYRGAPLERQIPAYGDWLSHYAKAPNSAAAMATSGALRQQPVPMQAAFLQGTQFAPYGGLPNTIQWPQAFAQGNTSMPVTMAPQAPFLSAARGLPPTLGSMNAYYGRTIPR